MADAHSTVTYKDIPGFPGYRVGNDGTVWSCLKKIGLKGRKGTRSIITDSWRQLKGGRSSNPYWRINLRKDSKSFCYSIHTLVLLVFAGPCPDGMQGCHNDGNPDNNAISNLRWDTPKANHRDRLAHGNNCNGEKQGLSVLTEESVRQIRSEYAKGQTTYKKLAAKHGVVSGTIAFVVKRKTWSHVN